MSRTLGRLAAHWPLWLALAVGLALRVALWDRLPRLGLISDEAEYLAAADWLANGRGFAWHTQYLWTRAPLYPLFVAGHIALFGRELGPIFLTQTALSLLNVALTYALTLRLTGGSRRAAGLAGLLAALYLPLASYAQLLLSETLFVTLLLGAALLLGAWAERGTSPPSPLSAAAWGGRTPRVLSGSWLLAAAGVLLGLATLTRGLTLGFLPLVAVWAWWAAGRRPGPPLALALAAGLTVAPWSLYASRAYGGPIAVDTTGAFNLALGARTAYDGGRSDEPTRSFVLALLDPALSPEARRALLAERRGPDGAVARTAACLYTAGDERLLAALERAPALSQAERQSLLTAEALCLLRARPMAFVTKSLVELADLFKINYTGDERLSKGFALGRLPPWYVAALLLLDDTLYVAALPLAVLGWALLRRETRAAPAAAALLALVGLWLLFNLAAAPLLFAINRFRVPLMPFAFALGGAALAGLPRLLPALRTRYGAACAALAGLLLLAAASPYAYLEPRAPGQPSRWASYLGPYPSSVASSLRALAAREGYLLEQELGAALGAADRVGARAALLEPGLPPYTAAVGRPLLDGLEGRPGEGLDRLATQPERPLEDWQTAVVAGELFRQLGDLDAARRELGPTLVDSQNPVRWAWDWLAPPPLPGDRLEVADDNDLGYLDGFYLGRYDPAMARPDGGAGATVRWATGEARLRFPRAASGAPQQLCLHASSLGWPGDLAPPPVEAWLGEEPLGSFAPGPALAEHCLALPARPAGSTLVVTLRSDTFVPDALDLIAQQGPQVGQLRQLAFQLDSAEVRP
ncbi:MAG TPA: hypothetical protein PKD53_19240 [Chloroflexaceae bacterium]|nr:hypothetical protein [Chloroflexaceae bacterium]